MFGHVLRYCLLPCALLLFSAAVQAEDEAKRKAVEARLEKLKGLSRWFGTWECNILITSAPKGLAGDDGLPFLMRLVIGTEKSDVLHEAADGSWISYGEGVRAMAPTVIAATVVIHSSGEFWLETMAFSMNRVDEDFAELVFMRTVNNWFAEDNDPIKRFSVAGEGSCDRIRDSGKDTAASDSGRKSGKPGATGP